MFVCQLFVSVHVKQVQLERLRSENTPALSPMNKFKNIIQVTPWLILDTTIEHFDKWTDKTQKPKQRGPNRAK